MIKQALPVLLILVLAHAGPARAASIDSMSWNASSLATLNGFGKVDIAQLLTDSGDFAIPAKPNDIGEFTWADLQGNGNLELVATMDVNGRGFLNALYVLWRGSSGKVTLQAINGWMIHDLHKVIRDLNGDGKDELIVPTVLFQFNTAGTFTWPVVYSLKNGKYVESSRDFPSFYEDEVLPRVENDVAKYNSKPGRGNQEMAAVLALERDRIQRMLGQSPTAGLQQAEQWSSSDDPFLLLAATSMFSRVPGYETEAKAAHADYEKAVCKRHPGMAMCQHLGQD